MCGGGVIMCLEFIVFSCSAEPVLILTAIFCSLGKLDLFTLTFLKTKIYSIFINCFSNTNLLNSDLGLLPLVPVLPLAMSTWLWGHIPGFGPFSLLPLLPSLHLDNAYVGSSSYDPNWVLSSSSPADRFTSSVWNVVWNEILPC